MHRAHNNNQARILLLFLSLWLFADVIGTEAVSGAESGATIVGEVITPSGPIPHQKISLKKHEGGLFTEVSNTLTDEEGRYKFENLPMNGSFILELIYNGTRHFKAVTTTKPTVRADFYLLGTLIIRVVHANRTSIEGLPIYLEGLPGVILVNKTTDEAGVVDFNHLDLNETYRVSFTFRGVPYYEDARFRDVLPIQINFTVYETTTSDKDIKISLHHVFVKLEEDYLSILENIIYRNDGIKVFNNSWLKASLPKDRFDFVTSIMDCCLKKFEDGILFDPMDPIKPGGRFQIWMEYKIKAFSLEVLFNKVVDYDTDSFYLFFENSAGVNIRSVGGLISKGTVNVDNTNYNLLVGSNLESGTHITVELSGLASPQESGWQIMIGVMVLAIPAGYYISSILTKPRRKTSLESSEEEKLAIFEKIAKLESDYNAGRISAEKYEQLKSRYKRAAIEVIRRIEKIKARHREPQQTQSLRDLYAEEKALTSTLEKLEEDFVKGMVSKETYEKIKVKFEDRRLAVEKKIKRLERQVSENEREA